MIITALVPTPTLHEEVTINRTGNIFQDGFFYHTFHFTYTFIFLGATASASIPSHASGRHA